MAIRTKTDSGTHSGNGASAETFEVHRPADGTRPHHAPGRWP